MVFIGMASAQMLGVVYQRSSCLDRSLSLSCDLFLFFKIKLHYTGLLYFNRGTMGLAIM